MCADLGSHVGGFVDCLLQRGAAKVYSIDTAYGILAWKLRKDPRVFVVERKNAMHVLLPERVHLVTIDVGWTRQSRILPNAQKMLAHRGQVLTLIKPHYEADRSQLSKGVLAESEVPAVVSTISADMHAQGWDVLGTFNSPVPGHGGNREVFALLSRA